jgi:hypothetical protein
MENGELIMENSANLNAKNSQFSILNSQLSAYIITFFISISFAQTSYEFDLHYGFGASELSFNSVPGIAVSIYPFGNIGFSAGLEYSWRWQTKTNGFKEENPATIDSEGDSLIFRYTIDKYTEKMYGRILQVPILFKYSNDLLYMAAGLKIGMVQNTSIDISYKGLKTEAYYPQYDLTLTAPQYQGFGTQRDSSLKTKISSEKLFMLTLEGGMKFWLSDNFALLAGVFADYSINKGFNRNLPPIIDRVENKNSSGASVVASDSWKSWQPWSIGAAVKLSFNFTDKEEEKQEEIPYKEPVVPGSKFLRVVKSGIPPPPIPVALAEQPQITPIKPPIMQSNIFQIPPLPAFLLNRKADFVFNYPETRTSPSDSLHILMVSKIADTLRLDSLSPNSHSQLHCVGYSEKLLSESAAYEAALQRSIRIRYTLTRFYGIEESRIHVYSQGSSPHGYRRAECFIILVSNAAH